MAYGLKYWHEYYDIGNYLNRIEILEKDYSGDSELITTSTGDPVRIRHQGGKDNFENIIIQGQELIFSFFCFKNDFDKYDSLLEAEYKDYKIKYYDASGSLVFEGYLKPENLNKEYLKEQYIINLSATDALADLKKIEFRDSDDNIISEKMTILQVIKSAIDKTGIELDFAIQLGTYEKDYMSASECALEKIEVDTRRFIEQGELKSTVFSCWRVIESVLKDFNVTFKQHKGKYQITNPHELNSYQFIFDYSTLTQQSRTATDNIIDLKGYKYSPVADQQKIRPLKAVGITFKNKDLGEDVTGRDLTDWDNIWDIHFDSYSKSDGIVTLNDTIGGGSDNYITLQSDFSVSKVTENDFLKLYFDHIFHAFTVASPGYRLSVRIKIEVKRPDSTWSTPYYTACEYGEWSPFESKICPAFKIIEAGYYNIKITFESDPYKPWTWDTASFKMKDVFIPKVVNVLEEEEMSSITYDRYYKQTSDQGFDLLEMETLLADTMQVTESGAFIYNDSGNYVNTGSWNSYGNSEEINILDLYMRNILNNRYQYKDYLRITIFDFENNIDFNKIITIKEKNYIFLSFNRNYKKGYIEAEIIELLTTRQSYGIMSEIALKSVDGGYIESSSNVTPTPSSIPAHNELTGLDGGTYHLTTAEHTELHAWLDNVVLSDAGGIDMDGELKVDIINEHTGAIGVDIESVLFKDGNIGTSSDYQGNAYLTSLLLRDEAISVSTYVYLYSDTAGHAHQDYVYKYGGTIASPAAAPTDAYLRHTRAYIYDGTANREILRHTFKVDGAVATDNVAGEYQWYVRPSGAAAFLVLEMSLTGTGFALSSGARVDTIESTLTDDATHLPNSAAVYAAISTEDLWDRAGTVLSPKNAGDTVKISAPANQLIIEDSDDNQTWRWSANVGVFFIYDDNAGVYPFQIANSNTQSIILNIASNAVRITNTIDSHAVNVFYVNQNPVTTEGSADTAWIRGETSGYALDIDQYGTGGILRLRDGTTNRFIFTQAGTLQVDVIDEITGAAGVTIDSLLIKDQNIGSSAEYQGNAYLTSWLLRGDSAGVSTYAYVYSNVAGQTYQDFLYRYGGTVASPMAAPTDAYLRHTRAYVYDGTSTREVLRQTLKVDGAVATDNVAGEYQWLLRVSGVAAPLNVKMGLDENGLHINNITEVGGNMGVTIESVKIEDGTLYTSLTNMTFQDATGGPYTLAQLYAGGTPDAHASSHEVGGGDLVDHDNLTGFVGNEHIDHGSVSMNTPALGGLAGGGTIAANRNLQLDVENLTQVSSLQTLDQFAIHDVSNSGIRKITYQALVSELNDDLNFCEPGGAYHDGFSDFVAAEHINWSVTGGEDIHIDRIASAATWDAKSDITMDGSTANGIITYGGVDNIDVEANLTFNGSTLTLSSTVAELRSSVSSNIAMFYNLGANGTYYLFGDNTIEASAYTSAIAVQIGNPGAASESITNLNLVGYQNSVDSTLGHIWFQQAYGTVADTYNRIAQIAVQTGSATNDGNLRIMVADGGSLEDSVYCYGGGGVELYYDASKKLETKSAGAGVIGALDINLSTAETATVSGLLSLTLESTGAATAGFGPAIAFYYSDTSYSDIQMGNIEYAKTDAGQYGAYMKIWVRNNSHVPTEGMKIDEDGKVYMKNLANEAGDYFVKYEDSASEGELTYDSSDEKFKTNIKKWGFDSLGFLNSLDIKTYDRLDYSKKKGQIGWIAQDVKALIPGMVGEGRNGKMLIKEPQFLHHFHRGISQLSEKYETHEEKIKRLERRVKYLENKLKKS